MKFSQIVAALGDEVKASSLEMESELDCDLEGIAAIQEAIASSLSYVEGPKFAEHIATTGAGALVLPFDEALQAKAIARAIPWVSVKNPRLAFARAIALSTNLFTYHRASTPALLSIRARPSAQVLQSVLMW